MIYSAQVMPAVLVMQSLDNVHAVAVTPLLLHFPFGQPARRVTPYIDFGVSLLFSSQDLPAGTTSFNFMPQAGFGLLLPVSRRRSVSLEADYLHISNADRIARNPGVDMFQFTVGYHIGF